MQTFSNVQPFELPKKNTKNISKHVTFPPLPAPWKAKKLFDSWSEPAAEMEALQPASTEVTENMFFFSSPKKKGSKGYTLW